MCFKKTFLFLLLTASCGVRAKPKPMHDKNPLHLKTDKISLLVYTRTIADANGNVREDESIVSNIRLNKLLNLELGVRQGERTQKFDSYFHYKVELQTKYFWHTLRFFARLSDNSVNYPSQYDKSNYLGVAEGKLPLSKKLMALADAGYVLTFQQNNLQDKLPICNGNENNYPTYKISLRYFLNKNGFLEAVYGAYDIFNPYSLSSPFVQSSFEYEIGKNCDLYSYFRYQYNKAISNPMNDFLGLGIKIHFKK